MEPTFFGDKSKPLFGIYHPPVQQRTGNAAVLICYPFFQEYIRSHRCLGVLADQLSRKGFHVFRFDYSGTGDSHGNLYQVNFSQLKNDVVSAVDELRELSGVKNISIIGLRMGALLASVSEISNINNLILWDPVIKGSEYIDTLKNMHKEMLTDKDRFTIPRDDKKVDGSTELLGFSIPDSLVDSIKSCSPDKTVATLAKKIHIVFTSENNNIDEFKSTITDDTIVNYKTIKAAGEWDDLNKTEEALMPYEVINYISELLN